MKCTYCESDNVQKCSIIYQSGTTKTNGKIHTSGGGGGIGFGARGFGGFGGGVATSTIHSTSHTDLAIKCSPPAKYNYKAPILMALIASLFLWSFDVLFGYTGYSGFGSLLILGLYGAAGYLGYKGFVFNRDEFPPKLAVWSTQWHCNKCGSIYEHQRQTA